LPYRPSLNKFFLRLRRFDARQVFDLPDHVLKEIGRVLDPEIKKYAGAAGKSETYPPSEAKPGSALESGKPPTGVEWIGSSALDAAAIFR
jgi:hypothetical protein